MVLTFQVAEWRNDRYPYTDLFFCLLHFLKRLSEYLFLGLLGLFFILFFLMAFVQYARTSFLIKRLHG